MRSLRLDSDLDERVRRAAALEGTSVSEFLRQAADERASRALADDPAEILAYAIGAIRTNLSQARDTGRAFADALEGKSKARR